MYVRLPLWLCNVDDLLHEREIEISHETVQFWWNRFGPLVAAGIRRRRVDKPLDFDEVFVKFNGQRHYLWLAIDLRGVGRWKNPVGC